MRIAYEVPDRPGSERRAEAFKQTTFSVSLALTANLRVFERFFTSAGSPYRSLLTSTPNSALQRFTCLKAIPAQPFGRRGVNLNSFDPDGRMPISPSVNTLQNEPLSAERCRRPPSRNASTASGACTPGRRQVE